MSFRRHVAPILVAKCLGCHGEKKASGGLSMATFAALLRGGKMAAGAIVVPGDPEASFLVESVRPGAARRMPDKLAPLADAEIEKIAQWIKEGAKFDGPSAAETRLETLVDPTAALPKVKVKVAMAPPISSVAYSADGRRLAAASGRRALVFDAGTGMAIAELGGHAGVVNAVGFSPDGNALFAAGGRAGMFGSVTVWDLSRRAPRVEFRGHADTILTSASTPDGKVLATAGHDRQILIWDLIEGKLVRALKDHSDTVYALAFSPDGKVLASCAGDRTVKLWDWSAGTRIRTLSEATGELYAVAFAPDGKRVVSAGVDRSIRVWRIEPPGVVLERSVFAHDGPVLRLAISADGRTLASSAEDRTLRLWDLLTLLPRASVPPQSDWVDALAFSPDSSRLAIGSFDGRLAVWNTRDARLEIVPRQAPAATAPVPPELVRNASLDPPQPRGAARRSRVRLVLTGQGVGRATTVILPEPGLTAAIVAADRREANRIQVDLSVATDARIGIHRLGVITPQGVPALVPFWVSADPEFAEREPNDSLVSPEKAAIPSAQLPATLVGSIDRPGDVDLFPLDGKVGQTLVFRVVARALGSPCRPALSLVDTAGAIQADTAILSLPGDPVLTWTPARDGHYALRVADGDFGGSAGHFYRIEAGPLPVVTSVFPLGAERGSTAELEVAGYNLGGLKRLALPVEKAATAGAIVDVPVTMPGGSQPIRTAKVVIADGPVVHEQEPNDAPSYARSLTIPGGVSGHIGSDGDVDFYRFRARRGETVVVEVFGARLESRLDSIVEVLDHLGKPIPRAVLRPVDQTEVAFRDHTSKAVGIRLTRWTNLAINDYILFGRELARIRALPRNLDDDSVFWSQSGQRLGMLETTPEQHPMGQAMYKVEIHPPGTVFPPSGAAPTTLFYSNDDGGPGYLRDSRVTFVAPADGEYLARVADTRDFGGDDFGYHLVLRRPTASFRVELGDENPNIPRGGTTLVPLNITRIDGFDGPLEVSADGLPAGVTCAPARIRGDELSGILALSSDDRAPRLFSPHVARERASRFASAR